MGRYLTTTTLSKLAWLGVVVVVFALGIACPLMADYSAWHYSVNVDISSGAYARVDAPVEIQANFTNWLAGAGGSGKTLDLNSVRVAEYSDAGRITLLGEKASQFDKGAGFDAKTNAVGEVVWILDGSTVAGTTRYFKIYYDVTENGAKTAPSYTSNLTWDQSAKAVETGAFRAVYSADKGGIIRLDNKTSGASKIMWNADQHEWWAMGQWHTINEDGTGWIDSFGGIDVAANNVVAGPARITITSTRNEGRVSWTMVRKYYAGSRSVDYWKTTVTAQKNPGAPGLGRVWLKRVGWDDYGAPVNRTLVPPTNFGGWTLYDKVFEYGADGGVGLISSSDFAMDSSESIMVGTDHQGSQGQFDCWGLSWRIKPYPIIFNYAFVVHNGTDETTANAAMTTALNDYNTPVTATIQATATVTGVVTDSTTAAPVRGAIVRVTSGSFSGIAYSSATGTFAITGAPVGAATFSVKADHYSYYSTGAALAAGTNTLNAPLITAPFIDLRSTATPAPSWLLAVDTSTGGYVVPPYDDFSAASADESGFMATTVPSDWDGQQGPGLGLYGWLRVHVDIPSAWTGSNLRFRDFMADDVDTAYFNGVKIGQTGSYPDPVTDMRNTNGTAKLDWASTRDYWVGSANVGFGASNAIAVRVFDNANAGGIPGGEPRLEVAPPAAAVSGLVSGPAGPIAGASLYIPWIGTVTTGEDGRYSFPFLVGDNYQLKVSAFGYKTKTVTFTAPDSGAMTLDITMESAATVGGTITRGGQVLQHCRVTYDGPVNGSLLTGADGKYVFTAPPGTYTVVYNALNVIPQTITITTSTSPITRDVDLAWGMAPVYDNFEGTQLNTAKWQLFNAFPAAGSGDPIATVSNGVLKLEMASERGGVVSTAYFPQVGTHEVVWARPYSGTNQIFNLYGGTGNFGNFVEIGHEGTRDNKPLIHVWGCLGYWEGTPISQYPIPVAIVRSGQYYDFYVGGKWVYGDTSNGIADQARLFFYGFEGAGGNTIGYYSAVCAGTPVAPTAATVGSARAGATGSIVSISGAAVSASFADAFWIEDSKRSCGIKVASDANPGVGQSVNVIGRTLHIDGEAVLQAASVTVAGAADVPDAVVVTNKTSAGMDGLGARAQGMRVTVCGKCTGQTYNMQTGDVTGLFLDDGSGLPGDGINGTGIYVPIDPNWLFAGYYPPSPGGYVIVTGVMTVDRSTGSNLPAIRAQDYMDIR